MVIKHILFPKPNTCIRKVTGNVYFLTYLSKMHVATGDNQSWSHEVGVHVIHHFHAIMEHFCHWAMMLQEFSSFIMPLLTNVLLQSHQYRHVTSWPDFLCAMTCEWEGLNERVYCRTDQGGDCDHGWHMHLLRVAKNLSASVCPLITNRGTCWAWLNTLRLVSICDGGWL